MDSDGPNAPGALDERVSQQVDNAMRAMNEKKPLPEIDFSIHTMEDGTQVSTLERVCKGILFVFDAYVPRHDDVRRPSPRANRHHVTPTS
jgi:hypothetical protein